VLLTSRAAASGMSDVDNELLIYNTAVVQCNCSNALEFWIGNTAAFPTLAPTALDIVSAPASQAYVERVFSVCGDITSGKRNRLSKNLSNRVFMKINSKFYNFD